MSLVHDTLASHPLARKFEQLGPAHVFQAVEATGRRCTGRFFALNSYENRVYQVEVETGPAIVAKFYRPGVGLSTLWKTNMTSSLNWLRPAFPWLSHYHSDGYSVGSLEQVFITRLRAGTGGQDRINEQELEQLGRCLA